jgi:hypothetical protein
LLEGSSKKDVFNRSNETELVLTLLPKEEIIKLIHNLIDFLNKRYNISAKDVIELQPGGPMHLFVPLSVFSTELSPSEAITKYLKEKYDLSFTEIAVYLKKESASIWASYKRANEKVKPEFKFPESVIIIPITAFSSEQLSILEALCLYMKDVKNMKIPKLSELINKDKSTLWTAYNRAKNKLGESK